MKTMIRTLVLSIALGTATVALAADDNKVNDDKQVNKVPVEKASKTGVTIPNDEQAFLERLHQANQQEIKLGNLALEKSTSQPVKNFAKQMVTAHTKADNELIAYAKTKNITLGEPKPMNDTEQKIMDANKAETDELNALMGNAFDVSYLAMMVSDHDMVTAQLLAGEKQFKGAGSEKMIKKLVPEVRHHRAEAYRLLGQVSPKSV